MCYDYERRISHVIKSTNRVYSYLIGNKARSLYGLDFSDWDICKMHDPMKTSNPSLRNDCPIGDVPTQFS